MSLFDRSYVASTQVELSRVASSSPPLPDLPSTSTSLLRSNRQIPPELRAPQYDPNFRPGTMQGSSDQQHKTAMFASEDLFSERPTGGPDTAKPAKRARPSEIGKMLFPSNLPVGTSSQGSPRSKRYSLPASSAGALGSSASEAALARIPRRSVEASSSQLFSPVPVEHRRTSSSHTSALAQARDNFLALPLANQLRSLKKRNSTLAAASQSTVSQLAEATGKIENLERMLSSVEASRGLDAEGWEAEASRLAQELTILQQDQERNQVDPAIVGELESRVSATERALSIEQAKKRRAKEFVNKLKCELNNRRWKEKYEIGLLEYEERAWEIRLAETECKLAIVKGNLGHERAEREELESIVTSQRKKIAALSASRKLLLDSCKAAETSGEQLHGSLSQAQEDLAIRDERIEALEAELAHARKMGGKGDDSVRNKQDQMAAEVKDLKARLKASQSALKTAEKTSASTGVTLEATKSALDILQAKYDALVESTSAKSANATIKPRANVGKDQRKAQSASARSEEDNDDSEAEEERQVEQLLKGGKRSTTTAKKDKTVISKVVDADETDSDSQETVRPVKSKVTTKPKPKVKVVGQQEQENSNDDVGEEEDDETPRAASILPATVPTKKRKGQAQSEKATNSSAEDNSKTAAKAASLGKKKLKLDLEVDEGPPETAKDVPEKKKKRKLFGGDKKGMDWQSRIENADVNGLIPGNLSPIKLTKPSASKFGGGVKKSIF
ncbi:uncharacterized protein JCM15063_001205 [Sporobolomyces koalae]|uniref:uncharacterized protein n=1 Tax=Sporobolomyces koalae TaxID=500713 RepID=UPI00316CDC54